MFPFPRVISYAGREFFLLQKDLGSLMHKRFLTYDNSLTEREAK
jgi:hypothetical protein